MRREEKVWGGGGVEVEGSKDEDVEGSGEKSMSSISDMWTVGG